MLDIQFSMAWTINTPKVYRYLPKEFTDAFFADGSIRLSSFAEFARHSDEEKNDTGEGTHILCGQGKDQTIFAVTSHGKNSYVLCGSTVLDKDLMEKFNCDSVIEIKNTTAFGAAIAKMIPGVISGSEGPCIYKNGSIECEIPKLDLERLKQEHQNNELDLSKIGGFVKQMAGNEVYFRKLLKYQHQTEYRFLWNCNFLIDSPLVIKCPEAIKFCNQVNMEKLKSQK